ncbi:hypothetical protein [Companilactobacillus sp. HBUAS56275]|uniref:Uncharacterized protein n=1 Tax=Candidatus Companilactobacillus pullicola TaxID=2838523 RepID=A0A9D1ZKT8_9LACO|nr:hypothetical protein [Candidatus Companilactobacillus pullicola]
MSKDFLDQINAGLGVPTKSQNGILQDKNEKTHPVQVRESTYKELKKIAFEKNIKIVDLVDSLLKYSLTKK